MTHFSRFLVMSILCLSWSSFSSASSAAAPTADSCGLNWYTTKLKSFHVVSSSLLTPEKANAKLAELAADCAKKNPGVVAKAALQNRKLIGVDFYKGQMMWTWVWNDPVTGCPAVVSSVGPGVDAASKFMDGVFQDLSSTVHVSKDWESFHILNAKEEYEALFRVANESCFVEKGSPERKEVYNSRSNQVKMLPRDASPEQIDATLSDLLVSSATK